MTFGQAVKSGIRNIFNIKGRDSRSEFWWFSLFLGIIGFALGFTSEFFDIDMHHNGIILYLLRVML